MGFLSGIFGRKSSTTPIYRANEDAIDQANNQYTEAMGRLAPYLTTGTGSIDRLREMLLNGDLGRRFTMDDFQADPGYDFRRGEGEKAIERAMAARGSTFSPDAVKALGDYNQNVASDEYGRAFDRFRAEGDDIYSRLFGTSSLGFNATTQANQVGQNRATALTDASSNLADMLGARRVAENSRVGARTGAILNGISSVVGMPSGGGNFLPSFLSSGGSTGAPSPAFNMSMMGSQGPYNNSFMGNFTRQRNFG